MGGIDERAMTLEATQNIPFRGVVAKYCSLERGLSSKDAKKRDETRKRRRREKMRS